MGEKKIDRIMVKRKAANKYVGQPKKADFVLNTTSADARPTGSGTIREDEGQ